MEEKIITEAFNINPTHVYGALVTFMGIIIFILGLVVRHLYAKISTLSETMVKTVSEFSAAINNVAKSIEEYQDPRAKALRNKEFFLEVKEIMDEKFREIIAEIKKSSK